MEQRFGDGKGVGDIREIVGEMDMDWRTPGYMVREKMQREKLRGKAAKRAWKMKQRF